MDPSFKKQIQEFHDKGVLCFSFPMITTIFKDGVVKKDAVGLPNGWANFTRDDDNPFKYCRNSTNKALGIVTGEISGITALDFDRADVYHEFVKYIPELQKCYTVKTNKGYHVYFKYCEEFKTTTDVMIFDKGVDIRNDGGMLYAPPTKYKLIDTGEMVGYEVYIDGDFIEMPFNIRIASIKVSVRKGDGEETNLPPREIIDWDSLPLPKSPCVVEYLAHGFNMNLNDISNYSTWYTSIICASKNYDPRLKDLTRIISNRVMNNLKTCDKQNYDYFKFSEIWDNIDLTRQKHTTIASFLNLSKEHDYSEFCFIMAEYRNNNEDNETKFRKFLESLRKRDRSEFYTAIAAMKYTDLEKLIENIKLEDNNGNDWSDENFDESINDGILMKGVKIDDGDENGDGGFGFDENEDDGGFGFDEIENGDGDVEEVNICGGGPVMKKLKTGENDDDL